jgi:hypothetical protein
VVALPDRRRRAVHGPRVRSPKPKPIAKIRMKIANIAIASNVAPSSPRQNMVAVSLQDTRSFSMTIGGRELHGKVVSNISRPHHERVTKGPPRRTAPVVFQMAILPNGISSLDGGAPVPPRTTASH